MTTGHKLLRGLLACTVLFGAAGCSIDVQALGNRGNAAEAAHYQEAELLEAQEYEAETSQGTQSETESQSARSVEEAQSALQNKARAEASAVELFTDAETVEVELVASYTPALKNRIPAKRAQNSDTVGWLYIPDTTVNTQIVQNPFEANNNYYLQRDFTGTSNSRGTYCADRRCELTIGTRASLSQNTTLYAHSFDDDPDSDLFSQLKNYRNADFAREHPYIYFSTMEEDMVWEVFAVYDTTVEFPYVWPELPDNIFREVMDVVYESSLYDYGIRVNKYDKILTLSTCTYYINGQELPLNIDNDYRFVIMAKLVKPNQEYKKTAKLSVNPSPLQPDDIPQIDTSWIETLS